ncbi:MAG: PQQ-dependent sugar dehydrogenase, partial [bacterium]|nr:PQQ-dependent sugar dehydrogenase [bacterium]
SRRAKILAGNLETGELTEYARGLRNSVFMTTNPITKEVWATEMGRDLLGDDLPPDEINVIKKDKNYGWPLCYGKNILDSVFHKDDHVHIRPDCTSPFEEPSRVDLQAHSAPLGLAFIPEAGWPKEMWNDLLVAYHGSWNRSVPTGYKIVRIHLNEKGEYERTEDFITGWLTKNNRALGRPVDILIQDGDAMYVTDDQAGIIYRVTYVKP